MRYQLEQARQCDNRALWLRSFRRLSFGSLQSFAQLNTPRLCGRMALALPNEIHSASSWRKVIPGTEAPHASNARFGRTPGKRSSHHRVPASAAIGKVDIILESGLEKTPLQNASL